MNPFNVHGVGEPLGVLLRGSRGDDAVAPNLYIYLSQNPVEAPGSPVTITVAATVGWNPVPTNAGTLRIAYDGQYHVGDSGPPDANGEFSISVDPSALGVGSHPIMASFIANPGYLNVTDQAGPTLVVVSLTNAVWIFAVGGPGNIGGQPVNLSEVEFWSHGTNVTGNVASVTNHTPAISYAGDDDQLIDGNLTTGIAKPASFNSPIYVQFNFSSAVEITSIRWAHNDAAAPPSWEMRVYRGGITDMVWAANGVPHAINGSTSRLPPGMISDFFVRPGKTRPTVAIPGWDIAQTGGASNGFDLMNNDRTTVRSGFSDGHRNCRGVIGRSSGKWYFEVRLDDVPTSPNNVCVGVAQDGTPLNIAVGNNTGQWSYVDNGMKFSGGIGSSFGGAYNYDGAVIGVAVDLDAGRIWWASDNVWQGPGSPNPATGTSPAYSDLSGTVKPAVSAFFRNITRLTGAFTAAHLTYSPPAGFTPWND